MTQMDDDALRLVAIKVMQEALAAEDAAVRARLRESMKVGARAIAELPDGTAVGAVTYSKPRAAKARVTNMAAFMQWVELLYPSEIVHHPEMVVPAYREVRGSFVEKALADVVKTGELPDGVEMGEPGRPNLTVPKLPDGAQEAIVEAFRSGALSGVLAIGGAQ